jgi:hypothetical protein
VSRPRGRPVTPTSALVPAAARSDSAQAVLEATLSADAIEVFAKALGGRDKLADTLAVAGSGPDVERITTLLLDPRYGRWSLSRLCQTVGLTVADLFVAYRKAAVARAHIEATHIIAAKLPPIVDDVMTRASPQRRLCGTCMGASLDGEGPCRVCDSTGYVQTEPELDRQKLALELGQLLEKKGGLIVQQNNLAQTTLGATAPGSLEHLQQAVGELLFGGRRRDVDIEPSTPPADLPPDEEIVEEEPYLPFDDDPTHQPPGAPHDAPRPSERPRETPEA